MGNRNLGVGFIEKGQMTKKQQLQATFSPKLIKNPQKIQICVSI